MAEEFKNVPEHQTLKEAMEESPETTGEVKGRGLFDFSGKKEEVKPQGTPLQSEFDHKTQVSEPPALVENHQEEEQKENKRTVLEELHQKHGEEGENKPSLLHKLHRSNSSSSSSSDEEGEEKKKKKEKKKIVEGEEKTEEEKKGLVGKIKEKLPGHGIKPEKGVPVVNTAPMVAAQHPIEHPVEQRVEHPVEHPVAHPVELSEEKKGILEKIKEKLPGHHTKTSEEEEVKKAKESV